MFLAFAFLMAFMEVFLMVFDLWLFIFSLDKAPCFFLGFLSQEKMVSLWFFLVFFFKVLLVFSSHFSWFVVGFSKVFRAQS